MTSAPSSLQRPDPPTGPRRVSRNSAVLWTIGALVALIALAALLAPVLAPYPGDATGASDPAGRFQAPSAAHLFGTDNLGRDVFSRVLYGLRIGPAIAVAVVAVSMVIGVTVGLIAGYFGGWVDEVLMRVTDVFLAIPGLLLALALAAVLPRGVIGLTVALMLTWWPWYTRLVRAEAASVTGRRHIEACRALGLSHPRIMFRHVLPNSTTPVLIQASTDVGGVILVASGLSFLGLGAQSPTPDWGLMIEQAQNYFTSHWWIGTFPGLAIMLLAALCYLFGDALRDRLDPRHALPELNR